MSANSNNRESIESKTARRPLRTHKPMAASTKAEADALFRKAKYGEAATKYGLAIKQDPENEKLYGNRAACCEKLAASLWGPEKVGWLQCGVTDGRKATTLAPAWGKGHARLASACLSLAAHVVDCAWERDDYDEVGAARSMTQKTPRETCFSKSARDEAAAYKLESEVACRRALALDGSLSTCRANLAKLADDPSHRPAPPEAFGDLPYATDAALRDETAAQAHKAEGDAAYGAKKYDEAERHYTLALAEDAADPKLHANRSACRAQLHSYRGALRDAETAARLDPAWAKARCRVGQALWGLGDYAAAEAAADAGLALDGALPALRSLKKKCARETSEDPAVQAELHRLRVDNRARGGAEAVARALNEAPGAGPQMVDIEKLLKNVRPDLADAFPGGLPGMGGMPGGMPPGMGLDNIKTAAEMQSEPQVPDAELRKLARANVRARMGDAAPPLPPGEVREVGADGAFEA